MCISDIEIHFKPEINRWNEGSCTVKDVLQSIPGFSLSKIRNKKGSNKKLSLAAAIQLAHDGAVDLESPESILSQVNMRSLLNKNTFLKLPPEYQHKLVQLLPQVDRTLDNEANCVRYINIFSITATKYYNIIPDGVLNIKQHLVSG